jgi:hypothetical protein
MIRKTLLLPILVIASMLGLIIKNAELKGALDQINRKA